MLRDARVIIPVGIAPADDFVFKPPSYGVMPAHAASPRGWDKWGWASGPPGPHSPPSGWARMPSRGMVLSQVSLPTYFTLRVQEFLALSLKCMSRVTHGIKFTKSASSRGFCTY